MKVFIYKVVHSGWNLAWLFMEERGKGGYFYYILSERGLHANYLNTIWTTTVIGVAPITQFKARA